MKPSQEEAQRAWLQARVDEAGSVEAAKPDDFTQRAWRELCRHYNIRRGGHKVNSLDEALRAVAELAKP